MPGEAGKTLMKVEPKYCVGDKETISFRKGVGKLLHVMIWSRLDITSIVIDL